MRTNRLSTLGYIMDFLDIRTTEMARDLHVDPSLISKFRSGARHLTNRSVYFEEITNFIIKSSSKDPETLKKVLRGLFPKNEISDSIQTKAYLKKALSGNTLPASSHEKMLFGNVKTVPVMSYQMLKGRQECIEKLLEYAMSLDTPCDIVFIDTDAFHWLWEDAEFSQKFNKQIIYLLNKGFRAIFAIRYSALSEDYYKFFNACNEIIFHKNASWYHVQYYDVPIIGVSLTLINHSISAVGMFAHSDAMETMVFRDPAIVLEHSDFAQSFISNCIPLFDEIEPDEMPDIIRTTDGLIRKNTLFLFLPVFAFIQSERELIADILASNGINEDSEIFGRVMKLNSFFRELTMMHSENAGRRSKDTVFIFQIEKLIERIKSRSFKSKSLSLICGREITINPAQHAAELKYLAGMLDKDSDVSIILSSKDDGIELPSINCWCMKNRYLMQMDDRGFRLCEENTIVSLASNAFERCVHAAPPRRRQPESVKNTLLKLAGELEN